MRSRSFLWGWCCAAVLVHSGEAQAASPDRTQGDTTAVTKLVSQYCVGCHSGAEAEADRRLDQWDGAVSDDEELALWQDVVDQLNLGTMPPEGEPAPESKLVARAVETLQGRLSAARQAAHASHETTLRRLNRREYLNTIRDLFGFDMTMFDPTESFPEDESRDGLDNQGEALVTSSYLLTHYMDAADQVIEKAIHFEDQPAEQTWRFDPPFDRTTSAHSGWVTDERRHTDQYQSIFQGTKERFGYRPLDDIKQGVPHDGLYRVRIRACGLYRQHQYDPEIIGTDRDEPIQLALVSGSEKYGTLHLRQSIESTLAVIDLPDDEPQWVEATVWLDEGFQPRLTYHNGPYWFKSLPRKLHRRYPEKMPVKLTYSNWWEVCKAIKTPQIRIHDVQMTGPLKHQWPPKSHRVIFGEEPFNPANVETILRRFATQAFRREVRESEIASLMELYDSQLDQAEPLDALKIALKAVLCSPGFLYLDEPVQDGQLQDHALASRLSYFLWSSMPDEELLAAADDGRLSDPAVLRDQTRRMLRDSRSEGFIQDFTSRWLGLYKLGDMPPDTAKFRSYYIGNLEPAMREETERFIASTVRENRDLSTLVNADFTFVNRPLAKHYGIDYDAAVDSGAPVDDAGFVRVALEHRPGGLLGHASVLTATANGIDTSPVIRGIWVLENILGTPPNPPPPDVEPIEPDTRGAKTIRDLLAAHREQPTCYKCHQKIDPLGFALEGYDAIGAAREFYGGKSRQPIDTSGDLPDGSQFSGVGGLRTTLAERKESLVRCVTTKLLSYATGREMTAVDRGEIDRVVQRHLTESDGMADLIEAVVLSETFRRP